MGKSPQVNKQSMFSPKVNIQNKKVTTMGDRVQDEEEKKNDDEGGNKGF